MIDLQTMDEAVRLLQEGEVVAMPTETVYGLAGDATNEAAVRRIFAAKGRPS
ncbi:MAG: Sua5/YciO/YrdC/YwlC family protein, partial [Exiguobacterium sp.]